MTEPIDVSEIPEAPPPGGLKIGDVYYVLFRHKWKIIVLFVASVIAALGVFMVTPPAYTSEAKLIVHYVRETTSLAQNQTEIMRPDLRGDSIINTELEILRSLDLARKVAIDVGPATLLGKKGGNDPEEATALVSKSLSVQSPGKGNVISMSFQHPDRQIVQSVLRNLIDAYKKKHREIHEPAGISDPFLKEQAEVFRSKLSKTEEDLAKVRDGAGIISLEQTKKAYTEELEKLKQELRSTETDLAERKAEIEQAEKIRPRTEKSAAAYGATLQKVNEYKGVCLWLESLLRKRDELALTGYTAENPAMGKIQEQINRIEQTKKAMEEANPRLVDMVIPSLVTNAFSIDIAGVTSRIVVLDKRMEFLNSKLEKKKLEAAELNKAEALITQLERQKASEEASLKSYSASLEQAHIAEALGAGKSINISEMQSPSPPMRVSSKLKKTMGMILGLGLFGGIGLAFLIEMVLDQSIRRPGDVETKLRLPLFVSVPDMNWKGPFRLFGFGRNGNSHESEANGAPAGDSEIAPWDPNHGLHPYYETLRDRVLHYFDIKNMTHKPKLVAITSASRGSGVTTIASGLAASLSETGDGNVLLVDMNFERGAAHPFHRGKPTCALPDVFENTKRDAALVQGNLYMASGTGENEDLRRLMPKKFSDFFPKFKASDYDYIIFDMPPVNQTSITPRLAGFMDMVLVVLDSEKTNGDLAKKAGSLLLERNPNVTTILNKTRNYVPKSLEQEF